MSHNDYTKYARENRAETPEIDVEVKSEPIVESKPVVEPEPISVIETPAVDSESIVDVDRKMGHVIGCAKLNVRRAPKPRAEVVCEINCDTEVEIDIGDSTVDFYKIYTASGIEGYCVKTYISVNSDK